MTTISNKAKIKPEGFFSRLKSKFNSSENSYTKPNGLSLGLKPLGWLSGNKLNHELAEELEDQLLLADVGIETTNYIIDELNSRMSKEKSVEDALRETLIDILSPRALPLHIEPQMKPYVILMVGVNGSGKTTTIGKLARHFKAQGHSVMLAAGDTFRAAAIEQLEAWGNRNNVPVFSKSIGSDPAAVIFDAIEAAQSQDIDILLADTAGRLQNQDGLMRELQKIVRVAGKNNCNAPHEKMLVLDSSLGQNALSQAINFNESIGLTGITMTKLDGGAKGGMLLALANKLDVPFRFIGTGEKSNHLEQFDIDGFIDALLATD
jgi:fused signal recognition particle receptor